MKRRRRMKKAYGMVLFFILFAHAFIRSAGLETGNMPVLLPYNDKRIKNPGQDMEEAAKEEKNGEYFIVYQDALSLREIPLEEFLIGALAAGICVDYESETLKAQAVLLRGNCLRRMAGKPEEMPPSAGRIAYEKLEMDYYSPQQLQKIWGERFEENYARCQSAVRDTQGVYAKSGREILNGNYHAMSAGRTRSGREVFADEAYDYLQSVPCIKNRESDAFEHRVQYRSNGHGELRILERDGAGYVTKVLWNDKVLGGEQVRQALGLASSNFEIRDGSEIVTKGIGHGFGFDQYYADYLARENGADYMDLISYFFKDITFVTGYV
ncbi:MAG: hypothetical protein J6P60_02400 [Lachnospiraceae bacterium]|nr:hypothetical protein [Lachnospiraceae bacterium]